MTTTDPLSGLSDEELVNLESKMFKTYSRLAAIVDSSNDAIIGMDINGIITSWNKAAENTYKYTSKEIIGKNIDAVWPEEERAELQNLIKRSSAGEPIKDHETTNITKENKRIITSLTFSPIKDDFDKIAGISVI